MEFVKCTTTVPGNIGVTYYITVKSFNNILYIINILGITGKERKNIIVINANIILHNIPIL